MVVLELDDSLEVVVAETSSQSYSYTILSEGEELVQYETSADPRTVGGQISVRNVVARHAPSYDKTEVGEYLERAVSEQAPALDETLGPR